jgi:DNA-directed RNA polymerase alpha subunit
MNEIIETFVGDLQTDIAGLKRHIFHTRNEIAKDKIKILQLVHALKILGVEVEIEPEFRLNEDEIENPFLKKFIDDKEFNLPDRARRCLRAENILTIGDLIKWTKLDLLKTPNLGKKSLREIEDALKNIGLSLRKY